MFDLRRREFITLLGGVAAWPLAERAQQRGKPPTIGLLGPSTPLAWAKWIAAFALRLRELGWVEGHTIVIEYRWTEANSERSAEIAAEFVRSKVDVIVTSGTANVLAAKQATSVVPIVFALAADPLGNGLVQSLARPGGNVTGLSIQSTDLVGKRLELLREVVPRLRTLAILANVGNPGSAAEIGEVEAMALRLDFDVLTCPIRRAEDIAFAFLTLKGRVDALYSLSDPLTDANRFAINTLALSAGVPTMHGYRENVEAGGLVSYGPAYADLFRRTGDYVDKILRGVKSADLPVEQPTKFELVINLKTTKALGLTVPPTLLALADEVIE